MTRTSALTPATPPTIEAQLAAIVEAAEAIRDQYRENFVSGPLSDFEATNLSRGVASAKSALDYARSRLPGAPKAMAPGDELVLRRAARDRKVPGSTS